MIKILRYFLILIFVSSASLADVPKEISDQLLKKKKELEPFDSSKVKVDLESLGLDDVDEKKNKDFSTKDLPVIESPKKEDQKEEQIKPKEEIKPAVEAKPAVVEEKTAPKEVIVEESKKTEITPPKIDQKKSDRYINAQKRKNLKKRQELERQRKENAKRQAEKLKKFHELRDRYLSELREEGDQTKKDLLLQSEEKIIPRRKDLNPFIDEELPALPILNRYRTQDNLHIPTILTVKERIDLLFSTISSNDVLAFIEAYKNVENPNVKNDFGDTLLTYSILLRKHSVIASVIEKGADVNMPNKLGYTPLNIAIELADFKSFEMLATNKADLNELDNFGRSYLMQAARIGFLPAVDFLVSRGVDINLMDKDGFTALAVAYRYKQEVIVQYLLKHGAKTWIERPYTPEDQSLIKELEGRWR
jgi:ankyrin repeat protein